MRFRVNHPQVINETIDGEAIMINLVTGSYYSLDRLGGEVWGLVEQSRSVDDIVAELARRYDASEDVIRTDVETLLDQLCREQLVEHDDGQASAQSALSAQTVPTPAVRAPWHAPRLEKFTDMQDLILLDPVHEVDPRGWPHVAGGGAGN